MPSVFSVKSVTNKQIQDAVMRGRERAQTMVQELGMADLLQKNKCWENPPISMLAQGPNDEAYCHDDVENDDNEDKEEAPGEDVLNLVLQEGNATQDGEEVASGISQLGKAGVIEKALEQQLTTLHRSSFK